MPKRQNIKMMSQGISSVDSSVNGGTAELQYQCSTSCNKVLIIGLVMSSPPWVVTSQAHMNRGEYTCVLCGRILQVWVK